MKEKKNENKSLALTSSNGLVQVNNSLAIINKLIDESLQRRISSISLLGEPHSSVEVSGSIKSILPYEAHSYLYGTSSASRIEYFDFALKSKHHKLFQINTEIQCVDYNKSRDILGVASGKIIYILERESNKVIQKLEGHNREINTIIFSNDGRLLFSGSSDKTIRVWEIDEAYSFYKSSYNWRFSKLLEGHNWLVNSIKVSNNNNFLFSGGWDTFIIKWDIKTLSELNRFDCGDIGGIKCINLTNDDKYIISGGGDHTVRVFDSINHNLIAAAKEHKDFVSCLAISEDNTTLVSGGWDGVICVWILPELKLIKRFKAHDGMINSIKYSMDQDFIISGGSDKILKTWI